MDRPQPQPSPPGLGEHVGPAALVAMLFAGLGLRGETYRRVSADPGATHHCLAATVLGAVAYGLCVSRRIDLAPPLLVVVEIVRATATLLVESGIVWALGRWMLGREVPFASVLRPLALAGAPGLLFALAAIPQAEAAVAVGVPVWLLTAFVLAIRSALDVSWPRAIGLALGVWLVEALPGAMLGFVGPSSTPTAG